MLDAAVSIAAFSSLLTAAVAASISAPDTSTASICTLSYRRENSLNASSPDVFTRFKIFLTVLSRNSSSSDGLSQSDGHSEMFGLIRVRIIRRSFFRLGLQGYLQHPVISVGQFFPKNHSHSQQSELKTSLFGRGEVWLDFLRL